MTCPTPAPSVCTRVSSFVKASVAAKHSAQTAVSAAVISTIRRGVDGAIRPQR
jgi:hypothetical protein